jgi:cold shock CspA family protein
VTDSVKREHGRVRWFKSDKGYGRITSDEFNDVLFVHFSDIVQDGGFRALSEGQRVEYTRTFQPGPHGVRAVATDVVRLP